MHDLGRMLPIGRTSLGVDVPLERRKDILLVGKIHMLRHLRIDGAQARIDIVQGQPHRLRRQREDGIFDHDGSRRRIEAPHDPSIPKNPNGHLLLALHAIDDASLRIRQSIHQLGFRHRTLVEFIIQRTLRIGPDAIALQLFPLHRNFGIPRLIVILEIIELEIGLHAATDALRELLPDPLRRASFPQRCNQGLPDTGIGT